MPLMDGLRLARLTVHGDMVGSLVTDEEMQQLAKSSDGCGRRDICPPVLAEAGGPPAWCSGPRECGPLRRVSAEVGHNVNEGRDVTDIYGSGRPGGESGQRLAEMRKREIFLAHYSSQVVCPSCWDQNQSSLVDVIDSRLDQISSV